MAIPEDRLSTTPVLDTYLTPDGFDRALLEDKENGPIAIGDISEGSVFQEWHLTYSDPDFTLTPADVGSPVTTPTLPSVAGVTECSFCFDQNGNITIAYMAGGVSSLYWYDTLAGDYTTTPSIEGALHPMVTLDDKRITQTQLNDVLLFYTKYIALADNYVLHMRRQRDRYETEFDLALPCWPYIWKCGMHKGLRLQFTTIDAPPT